MAIPSPRKVIQFSLPFFFVANAFAAQVLSLDKRQKCDTDPRFSLSVDAWNKENVDVQFAQWWKNTSSKPHGSLANELGKQFGSQLTAFECGIKKYSTCTAPGCKDYADDPAWSYLAVTSVVHLNTRFNSIFDGITAGQLDFSNLANEIALLFFPTKPRPFPLEGASFWIIAVITILASFTLLAPAELGAVTALGIAAFASAGVQQLTLSLKPQSSSEVKLAELVSFAGSTSEKARKNLEGWAEKTFEGVPDEAGNTILNYTQGGAYITPRQPSNDKIEQFYKKQMISRVINTQWLTQRYYITFSRTNDSKIATGPSAGRYYSQKDGGVYYLYNYIDNGTLRGHVDPPKGLEQLKTDKYNITAADIVKAAAGAWKQGGFNYSKEMANKRIMESFSSNGELNPFEDGAAWEGTWTLPVCDMGYHPQWNSPWGYSKSKSRYDWLPCCCGPDCRDTKAFIKAAHFTGSQTLLRGCKDQLRRSGYEFDKVDYGFKWKKSFKYTFALMNPGQQFGIVAGFIILGIVVISMCCSSDKKTKK